MRAPRSLALLAALVWGCGGAGSAGEEAIAGGGPAHNTLTDAERAEGWALLFDGESMKNFRGFKQEAAPAGWEVQDGAIVRTGQAGDLITAEKYESFDLAFEWRISEGGNSGVMFHVSEGDDFGATYETGPEYQVLDNAVLGEDGDMRTSAAANYALHAPTEDLTNPPGEWNEARLSVHAGHVEHWLNGEKVVEYELGSPEWRELVTASKFVEWPAYGQAATGHIGLQDHGDRVWYRNIRIREIR